MVEAKEVSRLVRNAKGPLANPSFFILGALRKKAIVFYRNDSHVVRVIVSSVANITVEYEPA